MGTLVWLALLAPRPVTASCGQAVCSLEPTMQNVRPLAPWHLRFDAQMEYIEQDQSWVRYHRVPVGDTPRSDHDEVSTTNLTWRLRADLAVSDNWSFGLVLPFVYREHLHLAPLAADNHEEIPDVFKKQRRAFPRHSPVSGDVVTIGKATGVPESSNFAGLGDMQATVRYSLAGTESLRDWWLSVYAGLKLPTGRSDVRSGGSQVEITLQPGTGSIEPLAGVIVQRSVSALDVRGDASRIPLFAGVAAVSPGTNGRYGYRPGLEVMAFAGAVYPLTKRLELLGQINFRYRDRDHAGAAPGVLTQHTGSEMLHLSPGLRLWLSERSSAYTYCQVPVLRRVNGIQLVSDWNLLFGLTHEIDL